MQRQSLRFFKICAAAVTLLFLSQCTDRYINLSAVPDREEPHIPLAEINQDLKEMTAENQQQTAFGLKALGPAAFQKKP